MTLWELVKLAWHGIMANRLRSCLTMLGIIIGIAAVIALLAIGYGAKLEAEKQIQSLGSNLLYVRAGAQAQGHVSLGKGSSANLTVHDANAIRQVCPTVGSVAPGSDSMQQVQNGDQNTSTNICGTVPEYTEIRNFHTEAGRFFNQSDYDHNARVAVLGKTVVDDLFGPDENPIGKKILIRSQFFQVIGVMEKKGINFFRDLDDQIFIPLSTAYNYIFGLNAARGKTVQYILIQARTPDDILAAEFQVTNLLRLRHKIQAPLIDDFYLRTQKDLMQTADAMNEVFTILLGSTAGISLLVGGIGIMNIMLVSVTERTREIGIRKAIGARHRDIMLQFVVEAMVLSLSGGVLGILLGIGSSQAINYFTQWKTEVTPLSVILSFGVSILVGLFFGIYPARQASRLDPIVALRAE